MNDRMYRLCHSEMRGDKIFQNFLSKKPLFVETVKGVPAPLMDTLLLNFRCSRLNRYARQHVDTHAKHNAMSPLVQFILYSRLWRS
jgi:hypothetical protein